jgi:protein-S-isoprenylcysteine O-methyltransferase Ste14
MLMIWVALGLFVVTLLALGSAVRELFRVESRRHEPSKKRRAKAAILALIAVGTGILGAGVILSGGDFRSPVLGVAVVVAIGISAVVRVISWRTYGDQILGTNDYR